MPIHRRSCHLCEAMCGVEVEYEGTEIVSLRGDDHDPLSRGHVCPKVYGLKDIHEDPDRLRVPLRKTASGDFEEIGWDEALDEAAARLREVQTKHGASSVAVYQGNPTVHSLGATLYGALFVDALRTPNCYSATSLDQLPHMLAAQQMFGHQLLLPVPDLDRTDFLVIMGANPAVSNGSLMSAGDVMGRIQGVRDRGGQVWVIDPRRTQTADKADRHVFVKPGTDALLLAAVLNHIVSKHGLRLGHLADHVENAAEIAGLFADYTATKVAPLCGMDAETIVELADAYAAAPRAAWYGRMGVCTQEFGGLNGWLVYLLNAVTENLDREGGIMVARPAVDVLGLADKLGRRGSFDRRRSRVSGLPEFSGEFPTSVLAEEIATPGEGQIRGLFTSCGNPVLSSPDGARLAEALGGLDYMVSHDIYLNETTRHAHLILPSTFGVEKEHYDVVFHSLAVHNTARYSQPLFERGPEQRHDWEILGGLAQRLAPSRPRHRYRKMATIAAAMRLKPRGLLDLLLRMGPHNVSVSKLESSPHGIDLGPNQQDLLRRLCTPNKKIQLVPEIFRNDLPRLRQRLNASEDTEALQLIGRRELRSNNSWMHNVKRMMKGKNRCTLRMHPEDAQRLGLHSEVHVDVTSAVSTVRAELEVSDDVMPGVVSLPHGYGHDAAHSRLGVAAQHAGVSANRLTDPKFNDALTGNAAFNGVSVTVRAAANRQRTEQA